MSEPAQENEVSELRKAAEGGNAAKAEAALAKKELAFVKAGINTDTKAGQAMVAGYSGALDAEALKAEAAEWGLVQPPAASEEGDPPPVPAVEKFSEAQAQQELRDRAQGNPAPDTQPDKDAPTEVFEAFLKDKEDGHSQTAATNRAFGRMIQAAAQNKPGARFDQAAWNEKAVEAGHGAEFAK